MRRSQVKHIPSIVALRSKLGVGIPGNKESRAFRRVVKEFHQDYKATDGTPGTEFVDWRNSSHRDALRRMTDEFLEARGWGQLFWPDAAGPGSVKKLKWSEDRTEIKKHVCRLFFRHNQQIRWKGQSSDTTKRMLSRTVNQGSSRTTRTMTSQIQDVPMRDEMESRRQDSHDTQVSADIFATPNPYNVPSSPILPSDQLSTTSDRVDATSDALQRDADSVSGFADEGQNSISEPLAPVARMSEHTVEHSVLFGTSHRGEEGESPRSGSPVFSDQGETESRLSPDLGIPRPRKTFSSRNIEQFQQNSRPRSTSTETARMSTEDRYLSGEAEEPIIAMPPPPPPRPSAQARNTQRRVNIKYEVERSPGNLRRWDHRGSFTYMSMEEFQDIHDFHDIDSVQFILKRRGMSWDDVVSRGNEDGFKDMKTRLKERIKEDLAEIGFSEDVVLYSIVIIPIRRTSETHDDFIRSQTIAL
ncbi:hypothetical protein FSST1_008607 [Fusarium sambucinum]